jgi:hypothetical protein
MKIRELHKPSMDAVTFFVEFRLSRNSGSIRYLDMIPLVQKEMMTGSRQSRQFASAAEGSGPTQTEIDAAAALLNLAGVRIAQTRSGEMVLGLWSDLDGAEIRHAIAILKMDAIPSVNLANSIISNEYKQRDCLERLPGECFQHWLQSEQHRRRAKSQLPLVSDPALTALCPSSLISSHEKNEVNERRS